jgi:HPt (histidine-containing phosphotransfer) domain-containing protein
MTVFDREAFLERTLGDPQIMRRVLRAFLIEAGEGLRALQGAIERANFRFAAEFAYRLRVAAANAGARRVELAAAAIEQAVGLCDGAPGRAQEFAPALSTLAREIRGFAVAAAADSGPLASRGLH